mgnify:CR=1 FL=1|tara:strand:- start:3059 stop:3637 length:579 start_codon:yes stop_codon:yes gene_type:complete
MPMPAVLGTVAQQGQSGGGGGGGGSSAPTSVSIATSSSGNYNNAVTAEETSVAFALMAFDGSGFSSNSDEVDVDLTELDQAFSGLSGQATIRVKGYIRATGATSFAWDIATHLSTSLSAGTASVSGTASTSQDATGTLGIVKNGILTFGGGRGGIIYPSDGDVLAFVISASATNSNGTTNANSQVITYNFTN